MTVLHAGRPGDSSAGTQPSAAGIPRPWSLDLGVLAILLAALLLRIDLATVRSYVHDEVNTSIPLARSISFEPGSLHLPVRGENHGALPAYLVKASSTLFGATRLGYRVVHVLVGVGAIALVALLTRRWYGPVAARWAAALFAFNEYFFAVSSRATAHAPYLFFVTGAVYAFSRFLGAQRPVYLYAAAGSLGLAFYCKEHAALLLPLFLLTLVRPRYRHWLRTPHAYLACGVFALFLAPDLVWNLTTDRDTARITYGSQSAGYATYRSHLDRIGGVGLSPYPVMFYARSAVQSLHLGITGRELADATPEYPSMNPALGVLLLGSVLLTTVRRSGGDQFGGPLLLLFWGIFGFFTFIEKGDPPGRLDPVSWIWVEATIVPAIVLTGARLAGAAGTLRVVAWAFAGAALVYGGWMVYR